ncbi:MAG: homocysteine S-methyltransferase family protein [Eubacteriales bacterium]|nr:homocysteine S-methyltransferase family protein [Eubacteriales bacterium]
MGIGKQRKPLLERLGKEWLFFDGGTGSVLQQKGLKGGELPETWNLTRPEDIIDLHCSYLKAGCDIFNTNTFGANALKYPGSALTQALAEACETEDKKPGDASVEAAEDNSEGASYGIKGRSPAEEEHKDLRRIVEAAVHLAQEARRRTGREDAYIALDIGPTGRLMKPMGDLEFERAVEIFGEVVRIGAAAGADLVLIETMSDSYESKAAVLAAKENCDLPVLITNVYDKNGRLLTGGTVSSMAAMLEGLRVDGIGVNCGLGPEQMIPIVQQLTEAVSVPILVNPNAGLPRVENGRTVYDVDPETFAAWMKKIAAMGVQAVGGCCGTTPEHIRRTVEAVRGKNGQTFAGNSPETEMPDYCAAEQTCGSTFPEADVQSLPAAGSDGGRDEAGKGGKGVADAAEGVPFVPNAPKHRTVVSSYMQAVEIGKKPLIIGERINPTGKKKFKAALRDNNINYILEEGLKQEESGAHILDVNVGLPEIDEPEMMKTVVTGLQEILGLPLQIDTSDPAALERGMRLYNGKPMVNSVNGKQESMDAVFPLVKKYGGVVVGLVLDENGIPETADGRIAVAKKIYEEARRYGIPREDIVIDGLAMTISSDTKGALVTLETLRRVRDELHGHTILGVSNISFGLPLRQIINAHFLTMAMQAGLSCAIMNPGNEDMMAAYRAFLALSDMDPQCMGYIEAYANAERAVVKTGASSAAASGSGSAGIHAAAAGNSAGAAAEGNSAEAAQAAGSGFPQPGEAGASALADSIRRGMADNAADAARALLDSGVPALELINTVLIPALDTVGKGFEAGTLFLPQLLMSAEAAGAAFEVVKETMQGEKQPAKGRVILATVKGDIHDIGKNIVKVMLENYGFEVLDLGKDVAPETIVEKAVSENICLVGLSALMTTTVVSMEETIRRLREAKPDTKVVVGGAVMTQEYADAIGADCYAPDAMATVHYAEAVFDFPE